MQQGNYTNITWNGTNFFTGYIQDNTICSATTGESIGVLLNKYKEVEDALIKCKNRLIELGEIKVPKTPEQIIQEQTEMLAKQSDAINTLLEKVNEYQHNYQLLTEQHESTGETGSTTSSKHGGSKGNKNKGGCTKSTSGTSNTIDNIKQDG